MCIPHKDRNNDTAGAIVNSIKDQTSVLNTRFERINNQLDGIQTKIDKQTSSLNRQTDAINGVKSSIENLSSEIKQQMNTINTQLGGIQDKIGKQISVLDKQTKSICNEIKALRKKIVKKLNGFIELKPHWSSYVIPIIIVLLFVAILLLPLKGLGQTTCCCCCKDTAVVIKQPVTIQFDIDVLKLLGGIRYDSTVMKQDIIISPETITIQQHSKFWPMVVIRIAFAIILLLALLFSLKYLVPYWTRIAEMNYKLKERNMIEENRRKQEEQEHEIREEKIELDLYEKLGKMKIEEMVRDNEHRRQLELLKADKQ